MKNVKGKLVDEQNNVLHVCANCQYGVARSNSEEIRHKCSLQSGKTIGIVSLVTDYSNHPICNLDMFEERDE